MSDDAFVALCTNMLDAAARVLYEATQDARKWHIPYDDLEPDQRESLRDEVTNIIGEQYNSEEFDRRLMDDPQHYLR